LIPNIVGLTMINENDS